MGTCCGCESFYGIINSVLPPAIPSTYNRLILLSATLFLTPHLRVVDNFLLTMEHLWALNLLATIHRRAAGLRVDVMRSVEYTKSRGIIA